MAQINLSRAELKRKSGPFRDLHSFVTREASLGHIVRQGIASMVPALLLDVRSYGACECMDRHL